MQDTDLFKRLLELEKPYKVANILSDIENKEIIVQIEHEKNFRFHCPECGQERSTYDHSQTRQWRHLDTMQFKTIIECAIPRVKCPEHGIKTTNAPWSEPNSRFTELFEKFAIDVLKKCKNNMATGELLNLTWDEVFHIKEKAVNRGLERRKLDNIKYLGIDEKSFLKGHNYATALTDLSNARIIDAVKDRTKEATKKIIDENLSTEQKEEIKAACADMWQPYMSAVDEDLPWALLVHDLFHINSYLNKWVDRIRAKEHKELLAHQMDILTKSKWIWLKNPVNWTGKEKSLFDKLKEGNLEVMKAWHLKEQIKGLVFMDTREEGRIYFEKWYNMVIESGLKPMIKAAEMLKSKLEGVLNYIEHKITNGMSEGMNSLIQGLKTIARGYRNFKNFRIAILFHYGKLDLYP